MKCVKCKKREATHESNNVDVIKGLKLLCIDCHVDEGGFSEFLKGFAKKK